MAFWTAAVSNASPLTTNLHTPECSVTTGQDMCQCIMAAVRLKKLFITDLSSFSSNTCSVSK